MTTRAAAPVDAVSRQERDPLVADAPLRDPALDRFGFVAFAKALALIIDHDRTATPLTIAVSAPWGGGKSSLGGMVESLLSDRVARRYGDDPRPGARRVSSMIPSPKPVADR